MLVTFFIFGLIVGSFLNAVIFRLHSKESFVSGRSHCMKCKTELTAYDLVPLFSFLWLQGRCRYCHVKLSYQYPLVEFLTGITFLLIGNRLGIAWDLVLVKTLVFSAAFILIAVYDFKHYLILDKVVFPMLAVALLFNAGLDIIHGCQSFLSCQTVSGVIGALVVSGFFYIQHWISGGRWIGFGDVKLGLLLGLVLGWPLVLACLFISYVLGAVTGVGLILAGRKDMSSKLPFGTFLGISAIISLLYGPQLINWYLGLITV